MADAGRNSGVTGLVDLLLPVMADIKNPPPIQLDVGSDGGGFTHKLQAQVVEITGPGDARQQTLYTTNVGGYMTVNGTVQSQVRPYPPVLANFKANMVHQFNKGCTVTFPVNVVSLTCTKSSKASDLWKCEVLCQKNGAQTIAWNGRVYSYSEPGLLTKEVFAGTQKMNDPNSITSQCTVRYFLPTGTYTDSARNAAVAAFRAVALPPMPNLQWVDSVIEPLDDVAVWLVVRWGYSNTVQQITYRGSSSTRSAMQAYRDVVETVYTSSDTNANDADSLWASFQSVANAFRLTVRQINPFTHTAIFEYFNPGIQVQGISVGGNRLVTARIKPTDSTKVQVWVERNEDIDGTNRYVSFAPVRINSRVIRDFLVVRLFRGTTIPDQGTVTVNGGSRTFPNLGDVNSDTFLGLAAGKVKYESVTFSTNIALSGTYPMFMGYHLRSDSLGYVAQVPQGLWRRPQLLATSNASAGQWVDSDLLNIDGWFPLPASSSFSAIIT